ncbi:ABC-type nitrate/sulfonate/bicarbonate transport system, permease component [Paenibacillus sophorae]|uniref:ABC transporter permease n=1 Tax=Paenibacillus sophorae TaxID=1333845 RepID=A0A1H8PK43_9BACL|nr:ABC transporter permease [Paenibacillus sophorae]QWU16600.1 ABC transporter permease [Paenibacillus sophorae]SEO42068.1 ABC-type nitrate/sulfonate/bicarbonate transport system, permease component [Paenibacillus sophorae]
MSSRWRQIWPPLVAVILFLALWQLSVSWFHVEKWILPAPIDVWHEAVANASSIEGHTLATLRLTMTGFPIGVAVGLAAAVLLHILPGARRALYPLLILSQNVPIIALGPLLVIWFGFGLLPKVILITLVCFFPVAVAGMGGLAQTDRMMLQFMKMAGATRWQIFSKLELPHALPSLFSGIKISAAYAVTGAVVAELIGSGEGLGYYMQLQKSAYRTDRMFIAIILIVLLSLLLFAAVALLEKWLVRWKPQRDA